MHAKDKGLVQTHILIIFDSVILCVKYGLLIM